MVHRLLTTSLALVGLAAGNTNTALAAEITLACTTSTDQSGLLRHILPRFEQETGIEVRVLALGSGQAIDAGRRGDADALLVHDRAKEDAFVSEGFGAYRKDVMRNDLVLVGPATDPARVKQAGDVVDAFRRIGAAGVRFVSRGDRSGTHTAELQQWKAVGIRPEGQPWYKSVGAGMGATLNIAASMGAYTLTDRGTWASFKNRQDLEILNPITIKLPNPYGVILVNPDKHPHVKKAEAERFITWITSEAGREAIASFEIDGEQVFLPAP